MDDLLSTLGRATIMTSLGVRGKQEQSEGDESLCSLEEGEVLQSMSSSDSKPGDQRGKLALGQSQDLLPS